MNNDTNPIDDLFRSKLKDLEMDTSPEDWQAIIDRLPETKRIPLYRRRLWGYVAASVLLLILIGGIRLYKERHVIVKNHCAEKIEVKRENPVCDDIHNTSPPASPSPESDMQASATVPTVNVTEAKKVIKDEKREGVESKGFTLNRIKMGKRAFLTVPNQGLPDCQMIIPRNAYEGKLVCIADAPVKKWRFGTGLGALAIGSTNTVEQYLLRATTKEDDLVAIQNAPIDMIVEEEPKTNMVHKTPLSFGFSVNRYIARDWSIAGGLTYTLLRSEWKTSGVYHNETKQSLHFIGFPLNVTCRIFQYRKLIFYAAAGGMMEINVSGQEATEKYVDDKQMRDRQITRVRMKEPQFSLGVHTGLSYPIISPISAFAEIGASYYFDNGSAIETVYSEKPFYITPQFGLRLSF